MLSADSLTLIKEKQNAHAFGLGGSISSVLFSPDGLNIVSGGRADKTIKVWDAVHFRPHVESEWEQVNQIQYFAAGRVESFWRNNITGQEQIDKPSGGVPRVSNLRPSQSLGLRSHKMPILPKSIPPGSSTGALELKATKENAHSKYLRSIAFNPEDGKMIVSGSEDQTVKLWDSGELEPQMPLLPKSTPLGSPTGTLELQATVESAHSWSITRVAFNPVDGKSIVSVSGDQIIKVWDAGAPANRFSLTRSDPC
eukprot:1107114-Prymnesium_polylepis.1